MGSGINGYDIIDARDSVFAFDFDHSGKMDHLAVYRPGAGLFSILRHVGGLYQFAPVYRSNTGIGGYTLSDERDRAFAFDFDHSGKLDHIVIYRPGTGIISIVRNKGGDFTPVFQSNGGGIGGFDLRDNRDRAFAFDYYPSDWSGRLDVIAVYRPGTGTIWMLTNVNGHGAFRPVYQMGDPGSGIGSYDLRDNRDRVLAFDYLHNGRRDHLLLYRPGTRILQIVGNNAGRFATVAGTNMGIGGYDLADERDRIYAFDYEGSGKADHLVLARSGANTVWVLAHAGGIQFSPVYRTGGPLTGIGGHSLEYHGDQFADFDFDRSGKQDHLVVYRGAPTSGPQPPATDIVRPAGTVFQRVYERQRLTVTPYLIGYDDLAGAGMVVRTSELEPGKGFSDERVGARIVGQTPEPGVPVPVGTVVHVTVGV